jgi:glucokinase
MVKLGIDIGGTTIKGAKFDNMQIVAAFNAPTNGKDGREAIISSLYQVIDRLFSNDVTFIGISSAGNINNITGCCVYATDNLKGWTGINIKQLIESKYKVECKVENDAISALIGEVSLLNNATNVTMLTFGTGVGGASIVNGKIVRGNNFNGGRWGHVPLEIDGLDCNCGSKGCAEQYLSATALLKYARKFLPHLIDVKELFTLYRNDDVIARQILDRFAKYLNSLLRIINNSISPDVIILGGGVAQSKDVIAKLIDADIQNVIFAQLGDQAGIVGASIL